MATIHDNNATTWRDLANQPTPAQIAHAERFQRDALGDPAKVAEMQLDEAHEYARRTSMTG
jgi:hypothetical protein